MGALACLAAKVGGHFRVAAEKADDPALYPGSGYISPLTGLGWSGQKRHLIEFPLEKEIIDLVLTGRSIASNDEVNTQLGNYTNIIK